MYGRLGSMHHTGIGPSGSDKNAGPELGNGSRRGTPSMITPRSPRLVHNDPNLCHLKLEPNLV